MAKLQSPGVSVTVTADPISSAAGAGTVPLFIIATAQDKLVTGSDAIATGTTKDKAGTLQLITSQKNTLETFGSPIFQTHDGSVVQGDELNEYGLHALYSYMGIANRAYVVRADVDMASLAPKGTEPTGPVSNGTLWMDTESTKIEAYVSTKSNPTSFYDWKLKPVTFVSAEKIEDVKLTGINVDDIVFRQIPSTGQILVYVYTADGLVQRETYLNPINQVPSRGGVWIRNGYTKNGSEYFGTRIVVRRYAALSETWRDVPVYSGNSFYEIESQSGVMNNSYIASLFDKDSYSFTTYINTGKVANKSTEAIPLGQNPEVEASDDCYLTIKYLNKAVKVKVVDSGSVINASNIIRNLKSQDVLVNDGFEFIGVNGVTIINSNGYSFKVLQGATKSFTALELVKLSSDSSNYTALSPTAIRMSDNEPRDKAKDGTYWYNFDSSDSLSVTLYVSKYSTGTWEEVEVDDKYIQFDEPSADRTFWVRPISQGIDGYEFYRNINGDWNLLDVTDQSTLRGILFEDFTSGNVPDAELYMDGTVACDLGTTEGVVKVMKDGKWQVASGTAIDGSGLFGRHAQRKIIVEAMGAIIIGNDEIRSEFIDFNLMCAPGYVELLDEFVTLNVDRRETAFIITDVPARLVPNGNSIQRWASNSENAPSNGSQGRVTAYDYAAQYMGWCLSTNVDGKEVAVPGSTIALRTYAYSDSVSYVWFPPAGTQRGVVSNASTVGYISEEGEYVPQIYNQGQRDVMYINKINPIAMRPNRGLLVYGDKTLTANDETAPMSRVNVARLVVYIRRQLELISEPFLFRLNTPSTRQEFAGIVTNFLAEIVQLDGLYDFLVVCDESNNTRDRINRNELWMDIALVPTRSINYIYVPIRVQTSLNN